jgi:hypothetical protein
MNHKFLIIVFRYFQPYFVYFWHSSYSGECSISRTALLSEPLHRSNNIDCPQDKVLFAPPFIPVYDRLSAQAGFLDVCRLSRYAITPQLMTICRRAVSARLSVLGMLRRPGPAMATHEKGRQMTPIKDFCDNKSNLSLLFRYDVVACYTRLLDYFCSRP